MIPKVLPKILMLNGACCMPCCTPYLRRKKTPKNNTNKAKHTNWRRLLLSWLSSQWLKKMNRPMLQNMLLFCIILYIIFSSKFLRTVLYNHENFTRMPALSKWNSKWRKTPQKSTCCLFVFVQHNKANSGVQDFFLK